MFKTPSIGGVFYCYFHYLYVQMDESTKYSRTLHFPISKGTTSDDRILSPGYLLPISKMNLIATEKLDGQNDCLKKDGVFARSHTAPSAHPWDKPLWDRWNLIKNDLKDLEIFGENMYGIHSIGYKKLESFYYVFAVREKGVWLSWEEVKFYAGMLDFPTVPVINFEKQLSDFIIDKRAEDECLRDWLCSFLKVDWEEYTDTSGALDGYDPLTDKPACEGFVFRNAESFKTNEGTILTKPNEFNNVFKLVRAKHVKTDEHWTRNWKPATLINSEKYKWYGYDFIKKE